MFLLISIGNGSSSPGTQPGHCNASNGGLQSRVSHPADAGVITLSYSPSANGPWTTRAEPLLRPRPNKWDFFLTNPSVHVFDNGTVLMAYRAGNQSHGANGGKTGIVVASSWRAPFERLSDEPAYPDLNEDPGLFVDARGHFHIISHTWKNGPGGHTFSEDGLSWAFVGQACGFEINNTDGSTSRVKTRERQQVVSIGGEPALLFTGVTPEQGLSRTHVQPINRSGGGGGGGGRNGTTAPSTAQQHLKVFWDFQEPCPPYSNKAPATAHLYGSGCDLQPYHYTNDTHPRGLVPERGAQGLFEQVAQAPHGDSAGSRSSGVFGNYSAHLLGDANGTGGMLMVGRLDCPAAYISGPNAALSMVVWFKHSDLDGTFKGVDNFGHAAGVWNEDSADRQYVIFPKNGRIYPHKKPQPGVGSYLDVQVSAIGVNTPGWAHSTTLALGNTTLPEGDWLCLGLTYDSKTIGAYVNVVLDVRKRTNHFQAGVEEVWENPYDMSGAYKGAPGGVFSGNGTFAVGGKAGAITKNERHGLPGLYHGAALYNVALTMDEMTHVCQGN